MKEDKEVYHLLIVRNNNDRTQMIEPHVCKFRSSGGPIGDW